MKKASVVAMVCLVVLAVIGLGAISAFVKIQLQSDSSGITGMATADNPQNVTAPESAEPALSPDSTPPSKPKFSIE